MPELNKTILFLEGYHSDIVQWNTMLEQYNQMHAIDNGVVFDYIYELQYVEKNKYNIIEELEKINPNIPIVKTNDFGHRHANAILPIGAEVKINADEKSIIVSKYLN